MPFFLEGEESLRKKYSYRASFKQLPKSREAKKTLSRKEKDKIRTLLLVCSNTSHPHRNSAVAGQYTAPRPPDVAGK